MTNTALPARCGVVGGGRMGAGIAHALLLAGCQVTLVERDNGAADGAHERVARAVQNSVSRGVIAASGDVIARLTTTLAFGDLAETGLVIEAVPEDLDLKLTTLRSIEDAAGAGAVIASNTSSISLATLAQGLAHPERLLGLHFFNPVPASKLVEVVLALATDPELRAQAIDWVEQLGKAAVVVQDSPGFASSRLGVTLGLEAIRMVESGVASAEDIDAAMTLGYGHPTGPLRLTDLVGSTSASVSPAISNANSARGSHRPSCSCSWSSRATWGARPARASTTGATNEHRDPPRLPHRQLAAPLND